MTQVQLVEKFREEVDMLGFYAEQCKKVKSTSNLINFFYRKGKSNAYWLAIESPKLSGKLCDKYLNALDKYSDLCSLIFTIED